MTITLELRDDVKEAKKDAYAMYSKLVEEGYLSSNKTFADFLVRFPYHLAKQEQSDFSDRKIVAMMLRLPSSMAIINRADKLADDSSAQIAEAWANFATDVGGVVSTFDIFSKWLDKIKSKVT